MEYGIIEAIEDGDLKAGDKLPSINELRKELGYAGDTVKKAYSKLKKVGLIEAIPVKGYFVVDNSNR